MFLRWPVVGAMWCVPGRLRWCWARLGRVRSCPLLPGSVGQAIAPSSNVAQAIDDDVYWPMVEKFMEQDTSPENNLADLKVLNQSIDLTVAETEAESSGTVLTAAGRKSRIDFLFCMNRFANQAYWKEADLVKNNQPCGLDYDRWSSHAGTVKDVLNDYASHTDKTLRVFVVGHSLGSVTATVAGFDIENWLEDAMIKGTVKNPRAKVSVFGFNQPKAGKAQTRTIYQDELFLKRSCKATAVKRVCLQYHRFAETVACGSANRQSSAETPACMDASKPSARAWATAAWDGYTNTPGCP